MESTSRGGETYKEASKSDIRNSQGLMEVGGHLIRWWQAASIRKKCFRAVLDLQSQGVCDYMHWSLGFLHVLQVIGTESIVEHNGFRTGFVWDCLKIHSLSHVILGTRGRLRTLNDMKVSWLFQMVFFSQREGCCKKVEGDRLMRVLSMCDYESLQSSRVFCWDESARTRSLLVQGIVRLNRAYEGETNGSTGYHGCRAAVQSDVQGKVYIQIATKEILRMRSLVSTGY
ncbi:hypothetical protein F2Q69_00037687 [Brassica cretica]|uniref:Uncharacterized protein n=1 Tax=Brassica cretica TaxID=69181 RepID=A0A8S9SE35_BRACR|nr:hypothetical protein F2Q69_00037687 [Brassica cretica]